ncbi:MAG: peptidase M16 [Rhodospirillales bacterium CG15_BIG_FIL_POST_REV_8_21_14_020_66_15]|nr:MAG: peptidase M16 [Rhodospirillales bacterium CG15_BIG_FIL_POST_REV_8_21_14_020_66_15]
MSVQITELENGLRVVTERMDRVETVSVGAWIGVGARHEPEAVNGVSHLLEHMVFKGTTRRSALAIAEEIEAVGGHMNAYTAREHTAYYAKMLKDDLGLAMDVISDLVQHATLDPEELERERHVVIQEIHQLHDTPDDMVFENFQAQAFPGQALGRSVLGSEDLIGAMSRDEIVTYMQAHYAAPAGVVSAAGALDHGTVVDMVRKSFKDLPSGAPAAREAARYGGGEVRADRDLEQVHITLGFEGLAYDDDDYYAASVLSALLGGGMSSRLFQEVREKRGLVYSIYSYQSAYTDGGLFGIYAGTGADEVRELMPLIADELNKVRVAVDDDEVARARAQLKASILMSLESTSSRCEQLARQMLIYGRPIPTEEIVARIDAVTAQDVVRVAERLFGAKPTLSAIGPLKHLEPGDAFAARLSA